MSVARRCCKTSQCMLLAVGVLSTLSLSSPAVAQSYALVDLTAVPGEVLAIFATDVNDEHIVVGVSMYDAVRWERSGGRWSQNVLPFKCCFTAAEAVNSTGVAVGWGVAPQVGFFPIVWEGGNGEFIPLEHALFNDINSVGQIVGHQSGPGAFIWEGGGATYLGGLTALGINDLAQVVGIVGTGAAPTAALWERIGGRWELTELGTLGGSYSRAANLNGQTQIVGWADVLGDLEHAFLWEKGVMLDLGTLGGSESSASGVNNRGQVVGGAMNVDEEDRAFLWQDGVMTDLNDLIVSETDLVLTFATSINELGDIVGVAETPEGGSHAFLARPLRAGDLNLDAFVDAFDLAVLLGSWGPCADCDACPADLDNDCTVGPFDLAILLGNWG